MDTNKLLGRAIKMSRVGADLTQGELAEKAGISVSYLSLLERGKRDPSVSTVCKIAEALEIPPSRLFRRIEMVQAGYR